MRKLISALVVIAIVSIALAFKAKPSFGVYCGSQTKNVGCAIINKMECFSTPKFFIKSDFNGTNCTSTDCSTPICLKDPN
jgi:hypothetical protein